MKGFFPLASGSKGNTLYLGTEKTKLLIDAGISVKKIEMRLQQYGIALSDIEGIIVTHEHHDHIASLRTLNQKWSIPIFCNRETAKGIYHQLKFVPKCKIFTTAETFSYKNIDVHPFTIPHDTLDPVALRIETEGTAIGVCTDLGFVSSVVKKKLSGCQLLYLEANHDPDMVAASKRPARVYLAHLSSECNTKTLALETIQQALKHASDYTNIMIAHQEEASEPFHFATATTAN